MATREQIIKSTEDVKKQYASYQVYIQRSKHDGHKDDGLIYETHRVTTKQEAKKIAKSLCKKYPEGHTVTATYYKEEVA
tara:strand:- start:279 stop:515 length:237 start_codon:yes stop_codon:yes gene_type:complete